MIISCSLPLKSILLPVLCPSSSYLQPVPSGIGLGPANENHLPGTGRWKKREVRVFILPHCGSVPLGLLLLSRFSRV